MTPALDHLAPFLLTSLPLDTLTAGAPGRVVNVSSHAHEMVGGFDSGDPQARKSGFWKCDRPGPSTRFAPIKRPALLRYARSRLVNLLCTGELSRRPEGTGVTVNGLDREFGSYQARMPIRKRA